MSVIVRDPKGVIKILTKGADSVVYERLAPGNLLYRDTTLKQLEEFATEGLRTLCCASAVIPAETYEVRELLIFHSFNQFIWFVFRNGVRHIIKLVRLFNVGRAKSRMLLN